MSNYKYKVNGVDYDVNIEDFDGNIAKVSVNGKSFEVELAEPVKAPARPKKVEVKVSASGSTRESPGQEAEGRSRIRQQGACTAPRHHHRGESSGG